MVAVSRGKFLTRPGGCKKTDVRYNLPYQIEGGMPAHGARQPVPGGAQGRRLDGQADAQGVRPAPAWHLFLGSGATVATGIAPAALVSTASSVEIAEDGAGWFSPTVSLALRAGRSGSQEMSLPRFGGQVDESSGWMPPVPRVRWL